MESLDVQSVASENERRLDREPRPWILGNHAVGLLMLHAEYVVIASQMIREHAKVRGSHVLAKAEGTRGKTPYVCWNHIAATWDPTIEREGVPVGERRSAKKRARMLTCHQPVASRERVVRSHFPRRPI